MKEPRKLDSLFTDLDPLGPGTRKDFFASKSYPLTGGASQDSLSNVGFEDSMWDGCATNNTNTLSELSFTNPPVPSSSQVPVPPLQGGSQRRISENSLRVALPPEEGRLSVSPGDAGLNPHSSYGSILELEASPRRYRNNDLHELYSTSQDSPSVSSRYGDCKDSSVDSSLNIPMPLEPPPALPERPPKSSSMSPPPLPPKKQTQHTNMSSFSNFGRPDPPESAREAYEFVPSFTPDLHPTTRSDIPSFHEVNETSPANSSREITVSDLVKMNVLELSQKLGEGRLPQHLSGLSLVELVEYIGNHTPGQESEPPPTKHRSGQFNIPGSNGETRPPLGGSESKQSLPFPSLGSQVGEEQRWQHHAEIAISESNSEMYKSSTYSVNSLSGLSVSVSPSFSNSYKHVPEKPLDGGFEDDFSPFTLNLQTKNQSQLVETTNKNNNDQSASYDRYAVFRELQLEEELVNAWKSPTEESTKDIEDEEQEPEPEEDEAPVEEIEEESKEEVEEEEDDAYFYTNDKERPELCYPVYSGETSPATRTDSRSGRSPSVEGELEKGEEKEKSNLNLSQAETEPSQQQSFYETRGDEGDFHNNNGDDSDRMGWANFEENTAKNFEFSSFLSKDEQDRILGKKSLFGAEFIRKDSYTKLSDCPTDNTSQEELDQKARFSIQSPKTLRDLPSTASSFQARYQNFKRFDQQPPSPRSPKASFKSQRLPPEADPFEAEWEPAFYTRHPGAEDGGSRPDCWDLSFQSDGGRHRRPTGQHPNLEEAFPPERLRSGRSSRASSESIFNNPFNDNFVAQNNGRTASATPPVYEGDRLSNTSDLSFHSGEILQSADIFDRESGFDDATFKIEAKTKISKSDSVNIFSVAEDPFDDDFFK